MVGIYHSQAPTASVSTGALEISRVPGSGFTYFNFCGVDHVKDHVKDHERPGSRPGVIPSPPGLKEEVEMLKLQARSDPFRRRADFLVQ